MSNNRWEDEELENFSLEDILAEFREEKKDEPPVKVTPPRVEKKPEVKPVLDTPTPVIDQNLFDEIKAENNNPKAVKKQSKQKKGHSTFDIFRKKKTTVKKDLSRETSSHAVLADRTPTKAETTEKLSRTIDLNDLFENGDEYDDAQQAKNESYDKPSDYVRHKVASVRLGLLFAVLSFLVCIPAIYLNFGESMGIPVPEFISWDAHPFRYLIALSALELVSMLINVKLIWRGIRGTFTGSLNMFSAVALNVFASLLHAGFMMLNRDARESLPYCGISVLLLFFTAMGDYMRENGRLRACKAASASQSPHGVFISVRNDKVNLIKHPVEETEPFTKYVCMPDGAERFWSIAAPIAMIASVICATISSVGIGKIDRFFWAFAAITSVSTPFFLVLCYGMPFNKITKKLSVMGAALGGWYAAFSLSGKRNLIMRDSDIFPKGTISSHGLKVFNDFPLDKVVSYTTSMLHAARSGLYPLFAEILKSHYGRCEKVHQLMHHESGGMQGEINGEKVLVGTESFMLREGVQLTERSSAKTTMYLAINGIPAAAFNLKYRLGEDVKTGLDNCMRGRVNPVLASVDCNLTPVMIESEMDLKSGTIDYPNIEERLDLVSEEQFLEYDPAAFVTRSGLAPFAAAVNFARRLRKVTIRNTVLSAVCASLGIAFMFYITFVGAYEAGNPYNVFVYMLLWTLSVYLLTMRCNVN